MLRILRYAQEDMRLVWGESLGAINPEIIRIAILKVIAK
jgi:hypothetical protein